MSSNHLKSFLTEVSIHILHLLDQLLGFLLGTLLITLSGWQCWHTELKIREKQSTVKGYYKRSFKII